MDQELWTFDRRTLTLDLDDPDGGNFYEIDLTRCNSSAEILDWIAQVSRKTWADARIVFGLVRSLDHVLKFQENICSCGRNNEFNAKHWLTSPDGLLRWNEIDKRIHRAFRRNVATLKMPGC